MCISPGAFGSSERDIEALARIGAADGFVTSAHDIVWERGDMWSAGRQAPVNKP